MFSFSSGPGGVRRHPLGEARVDVGLQGAVPPVPAGGEDGAGPPLLGALLLAGVPVPGIGGFEG